MNIPIDIETQAVEPNGFRGVPKNVLAAIFSGIAAVGAETALRQAMNDGTITEELVNGQGYSQDKLTGEWRASK